MLSPASPEYVDAILQVAAGDPSIARVLREICALAGPVRATALDLVDAHLRARAVGRDVLECVAALRRDEIARRIAAALGAGPPGSLSQDRGPEGCHGSAGAPRAIGGLGGRPEPPMSL